jgi:uroporphyrinogen decarboxylase
LNNRERFLAAVAGEPVDHPPCSVWLHFVTDRLPGEETARRHARFVRDYGWDFCKLMNDYRYPLPEGMETLEKPADMLRFAPQPMSADSFAEQLRCIRALRAELGPDMPIVDTTFDPFQQVMRKVGFSRAAMVYANPRESLPMLEAVCETMCAFMREARAAGADAMLFSINGAIRPPNPKGVDEATFRTFLRPFDLRMLEAMEGMVRILHVHGTEIDLSRVLDYPCEVISLSDRLPGNPSLADVRRLTDRCLMGGIDEATVFEKSLPEVRAELRDAVAQVGARRLMITPGCTIAPQTPQHILRCVREESRTLGGGL